MHTDAKKESIINKVKALLMKTPENGATEDEAKNAFALAYRLMVQYNIQDCDLSTSEIVSKSSKLKLTMLESGLLCVPIANIFSCVTGRNGYKHVTFVGTKQDVELCIFYYEHVHKQLQNYFVNFKNSEVYKRSDNKRLATSSFKRGFLSIVSQRLESMYSDLKKEETNEYGIILASKEQKINDHIGKIGTARVTRPKQTDWSSLQEGVANGEKAEINKPIC